MKLKLPEKVIYIIETLESHGFEAYVVGGCVRDSILARTPGDWDITTSATPAQVKQIFRRTIDTGIAHGTVTVLLEKDMFEVTTYRIDGKYEDSRHPKEVTFTASLEEDLKRRDFTINAMAYNDRTGLVDLYGGMHDLQHKVIRCVGDPKERFCEDALRMLRAVRFAAQLGFSIDPNTAQAIRELADTLERISAERIQTEIVKLLTSNHPGMWEACYTLGITRIIMPEFDVCMMTPQMTPHHCYCVGEHILWSMEGVPADKILRLTMLLHDIGKPKSKVTDEKGRDHFYGHAKVSEEMARKILHRLRFDNDTVAKVTKLIRFHDTRPEPTSKQVRHLLYQIGEDLFPMYLAVRRADTMAQSGYLRNDKLERIDRIEAEYQEIIRRQECFSLKNLAISGKDLIRLGIEPGKEIGELLDLALQLVLENPSLNNKAYLMNFAAAEHAKRWRG
ncbi:MAG: CCA tRNA nucleotidyltransferase [Lachnospiraceae bacterium]|nr:CCA tRNA nucleotidyltransferase [Lachnospiraceae bacterium]